MAMPQLHNMGCKTKEGIVVSEIPVSGGQFVCSSALRIGQSGQYVIDFKNTSTIARFQHELTNPQGTHIILSGGLATATQHPFLIRHGRSVFLTPGTYQLTTWLNSPYFFAQPEVFIEEISSYQNHMYRSAAASLIMLGIMLGVFIYYFAIGLIPGHTTERMYAYFLLGHLIFLSAASGVLNQLFEIHWFYLSSLPILFADLAYIGFVSHLLGINKRHRPRLYQLSILISVLLVILLLVGLVFPNWMLEMARYGVVVFLTYGLICGIRLSAQQQTTAKLYLIAISVFAMLALWTITRNRLMNTIWTVEQMTMFSISVEAILLALVMTYQLHRMHQEKEQMLIELQNTRAIAMTDRLTGVPNRHALENKLLNFPSHGCMVFLDMDNLKYINDHHGHEAGDQLLKRFSQKVSTKLDQHGQLYRLGGDEFAILCHEDDVEWCQHQLEYTYLELQKEGFTGAGASIGIVFGHEASDRDSLMRIADKRMYADKRARKDRKEMLFALNN